MKRITIFLLSLMIVLPTIVFADSALVQKITLEQKGEFKSVAFVPQNDFVVPTMIDVPLAFDDDVRLYAMVTDSTGVIVPSTITSQSQQAALMLRASDSFDSADARNMVDGKYDTFTEFPFIEGGNKYEIVDTDVVNRTSVNGGNEIMYTEEKYVGGENGDINTGQNIVVIDVRSDRVFKADSLKFNFDKNIERPTRVRVVGVKKDGSEQILLPEKFFGNDSINFPEATVDHYRIILHYIKPLRINEITFYEKDVPQTTEAFVRFIAQPKMAYDVYYNAQDYVKVARIESPNFNTDEAIAVVNPTRTKNNPLYKKADTDDDGVVDSADNCVGVVNPDQIDKNNNGEGDECEDFDRDGIMNTNDNCPLITNRAQKDEDGDGVGDKCDGEESRFMEKNPWIPYVTLVIVFVVVAVLIMKTLKHK